MANYTVLRTYVGKCSLSETSAWPELMHQPFRKVALRLGSVKEVPPWNTVSMTVLDWGWGIHSIACNCEK